MSLLWSMVYSDMGLASLGSGISDITSLWPISMFLRRGKSFEILFFRDRLGIFYKNNSN